MYYYIMTVSFSEHVIITLHLQFKTKQLHFSFQNVIVKGKHQFNKLNFLIIIEL